MGDLIISGLSYFVQHVILDPILTFFGTLLESVATESLKAAELPWVSQAVTVSTEAAGGLLTLYLGYQALTQYILWNEGTADPEGGQLLKGVGRAAMYGAAGTALAYGVFRFGIWLAASYMASPLVGDVQVVHNLWTDIQQLPTIGIGTELFLLFGLVGIAVALVVVSIQMAVRGAELVFFVVAAPLVALGQLNRDGGVWNSWWRSLVVLSLSQAVQWLGLKGMMASTQPLLLGQGNLLTGVGLALLLMIGWVWATIRGPHLLREWSYRTGLAGGATYIATRMAAQTRFIPWLGGRGG
jgi:hypothetical protein